MYEKIAETRSEAVDAMTRLAQRSGANTGRYYLLRDTTAFFFSALMLSFARLAQYVVYAVVISMVTV